ncbi:hypothetical protein L6452_14370 [Arctium lappa]|uniref:Uncharacterized protein n=1 Tax=Arctium lappa TaxID=4217 RepID=A0ACB9CKT5_ARCLA|nr:hypothetical protein L6452_14370 [Arctium lappa]
MDKTLSHIIKSSMGIKLNGEFGDGRQDFECGGDGSGGETSRHLPPPPPPATTSPIHNASAGGLHSSAGPPDQTTLTPETPKIAGKIIYYYYFIGKIWRRFWIGSGSENGQISYFSGRVIAGRGLRSSGRRVTRLSLSPSSRKPVIQNHHARQFLHETFFYKPSSANLLHETVCKPSSWNHLHEMVVKLFGFTSGGNSKPPAGKEDMNFPRTANSTALTRTRRPCIIHWRTDEEVITDLEGIQLG